MSIGDELDDLEAALDGLTSSEPSTEPTAAAAAVNTPPEPDLSSAAVGDPAPPVAGPPAVPPRLPAKPYKGRKIYDDLFVGDSAPQPAATGSPEEKVAYFRDKLRRLEEQASRFREAWATRDSEMDALEALVDKQQARAIESINQAKVLQDFISRKKTEMDTYGQRVAEAFAEKDASEKQLRQELERIKAEAEQEREELQQTLEAFDQDLAKRDAAIEKLRGTIGQQRDTVEARTRELAKAREESESGRGELLDGLKALNREVAARDEKIRKLAASAQQKELALLERDAEMEKLASEAGGASRSTAELEEAVLARERHILKYKKALKQAQSELHRMQFDLGAKDRELEEARRAPREAQGGAGWDRAESQQQMQKALSIGGRLVADLEIRLQRVFERGSMSQVDRAKILKGISKLGKALALIQRASGLS